MEWRCENDDASEAMEFVTSRGTCKAHIGIMAKPLKCERRVNCEVVKTNEEWQCENGDASSKAMENGVMPPSQGIIPPPQDGSIHHVRQRTIDGVMKIWSVFSVQVSPVHECILIFTFSGFANS
ncbi:hypothetical protein PIB30_058085 [Stylosanthes scabra]|uniref:SUEL-type lectin domain-containing protein n=1 Tax=Stylosanthes scabra TaxID=79078 RepID=A0ABU6TMA7_9FABA|nr:hypothetical protein [Stylosanthes scabra]